LNNLLKNIKKLYLYFYFLWYPIVVIAWDENAVRRINNRVSFTRTAVTFDRNPIMVIIDLKLPVARWFIVLRICYRVQPEQNARACAREHRECLGISTAADNAAFLSSHTCTDKVKAKRPPGPDKPEWARWDEVRARKRYERDRSLPLPFVIAVYPILRRDRRRC